MRTIFLFTFLVVLTLNLQSQDYKKIDSLSETLVSNYKLPGLAIVGVQNDEIVYSRRIGKANESASYNENTRLYIASNTKAFVGLAMAKLAFENKLSYNHPITKYIPESFFPKEIKAETITIDRLLSHTHGLSNDPLVFRTAYSGVYPSDLRELLKFTSYRGELPSTDFKYSNLGYLIAGMIIEEVSGLPWQEYVEKHLLSPLGMKQTTARLNFDRALEAMPYEFYSEGILSSKKSDPTLHAAGGMYSTLEDMARWLQLFTNPDQQVLPSALLADYKAQTEEAEGSIGPFSIDTYGNGWIYGKLMNDPLVFHFGSFNGYESMMSYQPETNRGVFVFVNERIGGQRIAAMLSAYYYLIANNDPMADQKIANFSKFIEPLYKKTKEEHTVFTFHENENLVGTYSSDKYGELEVKNTEHGFVFSLGKLSSLAYQDEKENGILIEWTPGIEEHFEFSTSNEGKLILIYGDFDLFVKKGK
ncbi:serine hydrolase domain-containing protein [Constantimarinum furrinae]|uniref:D-alanyl-D-alanine-carboxypeptidase n=1 Tax=Constantimarinum furrinae TaxID=2562285 RepID=A0A7G8PXE0_9FLAO|nr:serine hydrolase domain-containing protein [Constantimarinum furrinae]QNJ99006.1 D-alanyl-D-alanine-carboxypeptidase [Constantimarinum furrinae]